MFGTSTGAAAAGGKMTFRDMVLPPALMENARSLAASTMNTKKHGAPFRHLLMYGPPGTGKTMAAKIMARQSGLDYAIMTGGDVGPLGKDAVTQIHQLFDWSERSSKGVLLFIDEADAFLSKRGADGMSENMRSALNAVLYRTGTQTRDFVLVLATNRPGDLDKAIVDRMDEALHFPLPGADERRHLLELYLGKYILAEGDGADEGKAWSLRGVFSGRKTRSDPILVEGIDDAVLARAAEVTEGFSGRELAKLMASAQAAVHGSPGNVLTVEMFERVVEHKVGEHADKENFGTTSYV